MSQAVRTDNLSDGDVPMAQWARTCGLRKSPKSNACIWRLIGRKDHNTTPWGMGLDHCSLWLRNGKPEVVTAQPYQLCMHELDELSAFCKRHGLSYSLSVRSGHLPKPMITVEITRAGAG